jgi:hypothetical protein
LWLAELLLLCGTQRAVETTGELDSAWRNLSSSALSDIASTGFGGADLRSRRPIAVIELDSELYSDFLTSAAYLELGQAVLAPAGLRLLIDNHDRPPRIGMIHRFPPYLYTREQHMPRKRR